MSKKSQNAQLALDISAPVRPVSRPQFFTLEGLDNITAMLGHLPDPDTVLEKLGQPRSTLRAMEGDDEISQALDTRREAVIATPWRLESENTELRDWLWDQLEMFLPQMVRGTWAAIPYGYSALRLIYKPEAGRRSRISGIAEATELPFEWFMPRRDGTWEYTSETSVRHKPRGIPVALNRV